MSKYRHQLPQLSGATFMTDGGIETTLIFHERLELPHFAAFYLLGDKIGYAALQKYFRSYASLASRYGIGFILESPTWRANPDWGTKLGYSKEALAQANRKSIDLLLGIRSEFETWDTPMVISGCIGPRGDGYNPCEKMTPPRPRTITPHKLASSPTLTPIW
jgi:S-methylmethionine-dependent homocysteine/selenocysteine methylase